MKVIITRDKKGINANWIYFWPVCAKNKIKARDGEYRGDGKIFVTGGMSPKSFKTLFGFTPRQGSRGLYEVSIKKIKGGANERTKTNTT